MYTDFDISFMLYVTNFNVSDICSAEYLCDRYLHDNK